MPEPHAPSVPTSGRHPAPLTKRERQILGLLSEGLSGAQIAGKLVLSPETVRTHVRNAMAKLGASTRSQAVALALQRQEIAADAAPRPAPTPEPPPRARRDDPSEAADALGTMLGGLVSLYDVEGGAVYLGDEDGLFLRRVAETAGSTVGGQELPRSFSLGDGVLGRAALDRRAQLFQDSDSGPLIAAPVLGGGRLLGVIALRARVSRPIGRSELLLLQAFAGHVGEVLQSGTEIDRRLQRAMERFRVSWASTGRYS